jgi:hypothetical protein
VVFTFDVKGLRDSRKLDRSEMDLRVGNRARVAAVAVGTCELVLPSGLILLLSCTFFKFKYYFSFLFG